MPGGSTAEESCRFVHSERRLREGEFSLGLHVIDCWLGVE
jgi:hypothetical protein